MGEPMDGRCTDYCNDPAVVYHAHDLPRCKNVASVQINGHWLCNTHAQLTTYRQSQIAGEGGGLRHSSAETSDGGGDAPAPPSPAQNEGEGS